MPTFGGPAIAKAFAAPLLRQSFLDLRQQRFDLRQCRRDQLGRHIALVREIDPGFDQGRRFDDPRAPVARLVAEQSLQLAQRLAALPVRVGVNEIVESFGLGEIELAILERAPGKLAGLGGANIVKSGQRREQRRQHRASAMDMKLRDVFAGRAGRSRKPQHHSIVDRPLAEIAK